MPDEEAITEAEEPAPGIPELLDEDELCALLRISRVTAWRLRKARKLGCCRYGTRVLYRRRHVLAFLELHEVPATDDRRPESVLRMAG